MRADAEDRAHGVNDDFWRTVVIKHSRADAERVAVHFPELYAREHWVEDGYNEKGGVGLNLKAAVSSSTPPSIAKSSGSSVPKRCRTRR